MVQATKYNFYYTLCAFVALCEPIAASVSLTFVSVQVDTLNVSPVRCSNIILIPNPAKPEPNKMCLTAKEHKER